MGRGYGQAHELEEGHRHPPRGRRHLSSSTKRSRSKPWVSETYKPTSPARRYYSVSDFKEHHDRRAGEDAPRARRRSTGGRNHYGRITVALPRRRPQAALPHHRLQARQDRRAGHGRDDRVRSQPHRAHRAAPLRRRREDATSSRPTASSVGDTVRLEPQRRHQARQRLPLRYIPLGTMIHNIELRKGKGGQLVRSAGVAAQLMAQGRRLRRGQAAERRDPQGPPSTAAPPSARSRTPSTRTSASARPVARAGSAVARTTAASP